MTEQAQNRHLPRERALSLIALLATLAAALAGLGTLRQPGIDAGSRDALRRIVQQQCLPHWRARHDPLPCEAIPSADFAVLADRKGGAHYLLIATRSVTGIEDPSVLQPAAPNYFAAAWRARARLDAFVGHPLKRDAVGLAINSGLLRGQDQLHIHIECLQPRLYRALHAAAAGIGDRWMPLQLGEHHYWALRVRASDLDGIDPLALLAQGVPGARTDMRAYTLVAAGITLADGPGFILLAGRTPSRQALPLAATLASADWVPPGETLLDASCAVASGDVDAAAVTAASPPPADRR